MVRMFVFDLVDEVWDDGNHLIVRNGKQEERIPLSTIMNVNYMRANPPRITLTLRKPCHFGNEITFSPVTRNMWFKPFSKNPIVQELIERIDAARQKAQDQD